MTEPEVTILDHQALAELREDLESDFEAFVRTFLDHARQALCDMDVALGHNDAADTGRQAHALKGSAGYLGAQRLAAQLEVLQQLGQAGEAAPMAGILAAASADFEELKIQLLRAIGGD